MGAVIGAVATTSLAGSHNEVAGVQEQKAMQRTIARLGTELSTLKSSLDTASKSAHAQTAQLTKLSEALNEKFAANVKAKEGLAQARAEVTGSISAPRTTTVLPSRRRRGRRSCRTGAFAALPVARCWSKAVAKFTRSSQASACPALAVSNRSAASMAAGLFRRPKV
jgi:hypothetical protein